MSNNENKVAFKMLFDISYKELVIYANGFLFDKAESEDIVQDAFIKLWGKMQEVEILALRAYLYSIVRNKCINHLKKKKIVNPCSILEIKQVIASEVEENYHDIAKRKIIYDQVINTVDTFPARMKEIFKLKFFDNYKHSEIAKELGISVNTVKSQLRRAKSKIGQLIVILSLLLRHL